MRSGKRGGEGRRVRLDLVHKDRRGQLRRDVASAEKICAEKMLGLSGMLPE